MATHLSNIFLSAPLFRGNRIIRLFTDHGKIPLIAERDEKINWTIHVPVNAKATLFVLVQAMLQITENESRYVP